MKKDLIIIAGPTGVGKTSTSLEVAKQFNGEIISADSMQVYKYMDIGTAKITKDEMMGIPHYMIDEVEPNEEFSVALFREKAGKYIDEITSRGKIPIVVGGTGLYINSLVYPLDFSEKCEDKNYREHLENLSLEKGKEYVHFLLKDIDIESYERLFPNDIKRVIRALEVYKTTGKTISKIQQESREKDIEYNLSYIVLNMGRERLYERINQRVDMMFEKGLLKEVENLLSKGYTKNMTSMQAIGYKEVLEHFDKNLSLDEVQSIIKQSSRRYAKRQLTWFRKDKRSKWFNIDEYKDNKELLENIIKYIKDFRGF